MIKDKNGEVITVGDSFSFLGKNGQYITGTLFMDKHQCYVKWSSPHLDHLLSYGWKIEHEANITKSVSDPQPIIHDTAGNPLFINDTFNFIWTTGDVWIGRLIAKDQDVCVQWEHTHSGNIEKLKDMMSVALDPSSDYILAACNSANNSFVIGNGDIQIKEVQL